MCNYLYTYKRKIELLCMYVINLHSEARKMKQVNIFKNDDLKTYYIRQDYNILKGKYFSDIYFFLCEVAKEILTIKLLFQYLCL